MAIVVDDNVPDFLREFLTSQGVISVKDTETGETGIVRIPPRRRRRGPEQEQAGSLDEEYTNPQVTSASSGSLSDFLSGLFSSDDTDPAFQAMLTDVANQEFVGLPEQGVPMLDPNTGEYASLRDVTFDEFNDLQSGVANSLLSPSYRGNESTGRFSPNYDGFVKMRGQDFYDSMSKTSGNSVVDGAMNLVSGIGQSVTDAFSQLGGLFNTDNNAGALSAYGGTVPSNIMGRINPAFTDPTLSTDRLVGQALGTGLLGVATQAIPGANILGLGANLLGKMGFHHDYNPSRDANLNFDVTSGRFEWDSLDPGGGGVQYGSKANEQMIIDEANENPNQRFDVTWQDEEGNQKTGNISFGEARDVLGILNDPDFMDDPQEVWNAFSLSGPTFGSQVMFGNTSNQMAINEFDATGTEAIRNEAGAVADRLGLGYTQETNLAEAMRDTLAVAPEMSSMYDYNPDPDGIGTDFDADDGMGSMSSMGFGEGDFGTDGLI